jgi:hypothetical protein
MEKDTDYARINYSRNANKIGLETFSLDKYNIFDRPVDGLIVDLNIQLKTLTAEHDKILKLRSTDPEKYHELQEIAHQTGHNLLDQAYDDLQSELYIYEELFSLYEMKIIYAFKHLEINIKTLISAAYQEKDKQLYKWENLIQYMKLKGLDISKLNGYSEVNELRMLNNNLKHSKEIDNDVKNIKEFQKKKTITHHDIDLFYKRICAFPYKFLQSLSTAIYNDLYNFTDEKIMKMAKSFALRMNKNEASTFAETILKFYNH